MVKTKQTTEPVMLRLASPVNSALLSRVALAIGLVFSIYANAHAATLTPDPYYSAFHDSHPPAALRIARLRNA